jgi:hypothetical protein
MMAMSYNICIGGSMCLVCLIIGISYTSLKIKMMIMMMMMMMMMMMSWCLTNCSLLAKWNGMCLITVYLVSFHKLKISSLSISFSSTLTGI